MSANKKTATVPAGWAWKFAVADACDETKGGIQKVTAQLSFKLSGAHGPKTYYLTETSTLTATGTACAAAATGRAAAASGVIAGAYKAG